jgi:hypothetical protein
MRFGGAPCDRVAGWPSGGGFSCSDLQWSSGRRTERLPLENGKGVRELANSRCLASARLQTVPGIRAASRIEIGPSPLAKE